MRNRMLTFTLIFLFMLGASSPSWGAQSEKTVTIKMPSYSVTINGIKVNNTYSKYPFVVYNNITYLPMTYNDCRVLGLENYWKGTEEGLTVDTTGITAAYLPELSAEKNAGSYRASIPTFPIKVNGNVVNNVKQQYPLLSFRDIIYFPMTWSYAVKEFGWSYSFSAKDGLVINSTNIKLGQITIPDELIENTSGEITDDVALTDKYYYYKGSDGQIIQGSLAEPLQTKVVYQLPLWSYGQGVYVTSELYNDGGTVYLAYHQGGAVMGSDYVIQLNDDGTNAVLQRSYTRVKTFGDKSFAYYTGGAPGPGNLSMKAGDGEYELVGNPDFLYGWAWTFDGEISSGGGSDDVYLIGDNLYILAFDMKSGVVQTTGIYKININTNETMRVSNNQAMAFTLDGDYLYYENDGILYCISVKDGQEKLIKQLAKSPNSVSNLEVLNGKVYWRDGLNNNLYNLDGENLNPGAVMDDMKLMGDNSEYLVCTFQETSLSKYRIMVFDKNGTVVFKTSDTSNCNNICIKGSKLYFYNSTTGTICSGQLLQK